MMNMTKMLAADGEGASKMIECTVSEARLLKATVPCVNSSEERAQISLR